MDHRGHIGQNHCIACSLVLCLATAKRLKLVPEPVAHERKLWNLQAIEAHLQHRAGYVFRMLEVSPRLAQKGGSEESLLALWRKASCKFLESRPRAIIENFMSDDKVADDQRFFE